MEGYPKKHSSLAEGEYWLCSDKSMHKKAADAVCHEANLELCATTQHIADDVDAEVLKKVSVKPTKLVATHTGMLYGIKIKAGELISPEFTSQQIECGLENGWFAEAKTSAAEKYQAKLSGKTHAAQLPTRMPCRWYIFPLPWTEWNKSILHPAVPKDGSVFWRSKTIETTDAFDIAVGQLASMGEQRVFVSVHLDTDKVGRWRKFFGTASGALKWIDATVPTTW